jgi:diguanylate cyclase (GGDEF)-like protein
MDVLSQTLLLAMAMLAVCAAALSAFSLTQRTYRGFHCWSAALWLNTAALGAILWTGPGAGASLLALLMLMPWPTLTLVGVRHFHARTALPGNERIDLGVLGVALIVGALACTALAEHTAGHWTVLWLTALVQLYATAILARAPASAEARPLRALAALWPFLAVLPLAGIRWLADPVDAVVLQVSMVSIGSVALGFFALSLSSRRTESDLRRSHQRLRVLANIDMLTQVPNRRRFEELARRALHADEPGSAVLLLLDIDHFKQINDKLGHAAGDRALRLVSRCTLDLLRSHDVAGRHGGDEFVLLLRRSSTDQAMIVAERLVAHLQTQSHAHALPRLSLSFGIVQMRAGESIDQTLQRADLALYEAKRLGRSRAVAADGEEEQPTFRSSQRLGLTSS